MGFVSYNNKTKSEPHHAMIKELIDQYRNTDLIQLKQLFANLQNLSIYSPVQYLSSLQIH